MKLKDKVIDMYCDDLPIVRACAKARVITALAKDMKANHVDLLAALSNEKGFSKAAAAAALAPFVADNPDILDAFLKQIDSEDFDKVGVIVVSALGKVEYREDICKALIQKSALSANSESSEFCNTPSIRLATVEALSRFAEREEVRQALLDTLDNEKNPTVSCKLIEILAPQLENENVKNLFLRIATARSVHEWKIESKVAVIEKLGAVVSKQEDIKQQLLDLLYNSSDKIKAACIHALCPEDQKPLLTPYALFILAFTDSSGEVREAGRHLLVLWLKD
jgi:hypothetical protein